MKGLLLGALGLNVFLFIITISAFAAGDVTIFYPLVHVALAVIIWNSIRGFD
jgi:hypothetical protein